MNTLLLTFIKLFVATDALGTLPFYIALSEGMDREEKRRAIGLSLFTSLAIVVGFIMVGHWLLDVLEVSVGDFRVAGGLLLLILSVDIMKHDEATKAKTSDHMIGVVPLGTPLIAGPCVLTMVLVLTRSVGPIVTLTAAVVNILVACLIFTYAGWFTKILGATASKAFSKVSALLLAGLAITMMRQGVLSAIEQARAVWE
ncbi:MAG: MarC family protein [Planctomycetota bacterium]